LNKGNCGGRGCWPAGGKGNLKKEESLKEPSKTEKGKKNFKCGSDTREIKKRGTRGGNRDSQEGQGGLLTSKSVA